MPGTFVRFATTCSAKMLVSEIERLPLRVKANRDLPPSEERLVQSDGLLD